MEKKKLAHSTTTSPLPTRQSHQLKTCTEPPTPRDMLSLELVTSPPKKKSNTIFRIVVNDSEEDEERKCSDEIRG